MSTARLELTREQILAFRRRSGALDERLPPGARSLRRAAWAGLQDSMPRAALLSIHARVSGTGPATWEDPSLVQLWGPRFNVFVVARRDLAVFSLGTLPDDARGRRRSQELAARLDAFLAGRVMPYGEVGDALGMNPNRLRYAAATGTVLIRWGGAGLSTIWTVPPPEMDAAEARLELARRYLHVYGPTTGAAFGRWAAIGERPALVAFDALGRSLIPVRTPIGDASILGTDEADVRTAAAAGVSAQAPAARLLPSGDSYLLLHGRDRELMVPDPAERASLWTPRVWPGGVLVDGEVVGTWRRADRVVVVQAWRKLSAAQRDAVTAEAAGLPIPGIGDMTLRWED